MAYRIRRGIGSFLPEQDPTGIAQSNWANCIGWSSYLNPGCYFSGPKSQLAPPPSPSGPVLTVPPASGEQAQQTVDELLNEQMAAQQQLAGSQVTSGVLDQASSVVVDTSSALAAPFGVPWWAWLAGGVGIFAFAALSGGSPRRYGR